MEIVEKVLGLTWLVLCVGMLGYFISSYIQEKIKEQ